MRKGQPDDKLEEMKNMTSKCSKMIEDAKRKYFLKAGKTLANPGTGLKTYWSLLNSVLNKAKIPIIPPLLENRIFVMDFTEKAQIFNNHFILQYTTIDTGSEILRNNPVNVKRKATFVIPLTKMVRDRGINNNIPRLVV